MNEFLVPFLAFTLVCVVVVLVVERFFYAQQVQKNEEKLLDELSKAIKAVIAKNANDYVMTTSIDKVPVEKQEKQDSDLIDPDALTDDQFDAALGIERKAPK